MKQIPQFHKLGSDPEFLFVSRKEFRPTVIPANSVITANKTLALRSFIGTDNHAATAEMRPGPAHNVGRHLYDIAYGLHETDKWLATHKRHKDVKLVAQPWIGDEPLGGHVHCSFFIDEPDTKEALALNRVYKNDRIMTFDETQPVPPLTGPQARMFERYAEARYQDNLYMPSDFGRDMDYLLLPFEVAVQPWWDRQRRNGRYGGTSGVGDRVRQNVSYPKGANKFNKLAYLHYEYRVPSTWLCHPWLAYCYLGLAKLTMLNVKLIREDKVTPYPKTVPEPMNDQYKKVFESRLRKIMDKGKWSNDLKSLTDILPLCFDQRAAWFEVAGQPIDIEAWRKLL